MMVSVALRDRDPDGDRRLVLTAPHAGGVLSHEAHVGAGVYVDVDLMAPDRWCSISVRTVDDATEPLLTALIGDQAVQGLRRYAHRRPSGDGDPTRHSLAVDPGDAAPWIRVAVVDALDRWLHLPLDQSLVDAERGVSRGWAARTLPADAAARVIVLGEGLQLARRASSNVVGYLRTLGSRHRAVPSGLLAAVRHLMQGYTELVTEVSGPDRELAAVLDTWRHVSDRISAMDSDEAAVGTLTLGPIGRPHLPSRRSRPASMIDPRQIRARVFAQSSDPSAAEVTMTDTRVNDHPAVLVCVPAFRRPLDQQVVPRLLVRLVDSLSADPRGTAVLTASPTPTGRRRGRYFEGIVPLRGSSVGNLRADVFDALSDVPPARGDTDEALQGARRATVFLGEWRHLLALAQLPTAVTAPARWLRELATRLEPKDRGPTQPLFADGPSPDDLQRLAAASDVELLRRARWPEHDDHHSTAAGLFALAWGSGRLLVAEIAAAHSSAAR
jgi:hypothetical protein